MIDIEVKDKRVVDEFVKIFNCPPMLRCRAIAETGTYKGTGTTQLVINAWNKIGMHKKEVDVPPFITIEADEQNYKEAQENLGEYSSWIDMRYGISLDLDECLDFINSDLFCTSNVATEIYNLKTDNPDPISFYKRELYGQLFSDGERGADGILYDVISEVQAKSPLFILDSCGGIGLLEYATVLEKMNGKRFYVWLHDIGHIKHYRSCEHIKATKGVEVLAEEEGEWILARFNRNKSVANTYVASEVIESCNMSL
jgi:hypothetical protein